MSVKSPSSPQNQASVYNLESLPIDEHPHNHASEAEAEICAICQDVLEAKPLASTRCHHKFHAECLLNAFKYNPKCPICRFNPFPNAQPNNEDEIEGASPGEIAGRELEIAAGSGNDQEVIRLIESSNIDQEFIDGAFFEAAENSHTSIIRFFIDSPREISPDTRAEAALAVYEKITEEPNNRELKVLYQSILDSGPILLTYEPLFELPQDFVDNAALYAANEQLDDVFDRVTNGASISDATALQIIDAIVSHQNWYMMELLIQPQNSEVIKDEIRKVLQSHEQNELLDLLD